MKTSIAVIHDAEQPKLGIALGGGSARGYAHIGALASLERHGLKPRAIAGTSFGAIVGAFYASGKNPQQMRDFASKMGKEIYRRFADFGLHKAALFHGDRMEAYLDELYEGRHFSDLACDFVVVATDVDSGERVLIDQGPLARAIRASSTLPGIFAPVEINGRRLMDGGIGAPIPHETLNTMDIDIALGIGVGIESGDSKSIQWAQKMLETPLGDRIHRAMRDHQGVHPLGVLGRALAHTATLWREDPSPLKDALHIQTRPPIHWFNFHSAEKAIQAGEQAMDAFAPRLLGVLEEHTLTQAAA